MNSRDRRLFWLLALSGLALLPIGMTAAVMRGLAQVRAIGDSRPRIVAAWPSGAMEVRVAFGEAVDPGVARALVGQAIPFYDSRGGGGSGRPGGNNGSIRIAAARLDDAHRTLILATDPHPAEATYHLTLSELKRDGEPGRGGEAAAYYGLAGVEAAWTAEGADQPEWSGWWPEIEPGRVRRELAGSVDHDRLWPLLSRPGKLALRSYVRLPSGPTASTVAGDAAGEVTLGQESAKLESGQAATLKVDAEGQSVELAATLATGPGRPEPPTLLWRVGPSGTPSEARELARSAFGLAWAPPTLPDPPAPTIPDALAAGGDPARGALVFAGETAKCATCHRVRGVGGQVGPDLSNLSKATRAWVYQNIVEPSAAIHPDYLSYTVAFKDGRVAMGTVRAEGLDAIRVGDNDAKSTTFPRAEIEELRPSPSSIMPVGLLQALGDERTRDLLAYLTDPANLAPAAPPARP